MEPADQRREHLQASIDRMHGKTVPQWSPPTSGGSTYAE